ncbi:MAG: hypothetical protein WC312_01330 [Candidatus Omnitrophota bacterium]|jgi:hypothetical protein
MGKNKFERHPLITISIFILTVIFTLDFLSANIYSLINRYPFYARGQKKKEEMDRVYHVRSAIYHHDLARNKAVDYGARGNYRHIVYTNSLGFKDKACGDVPLISDKYRVLFIGDSFVEGIGFNYEDTFVGLIGAELAKKGIEVLNAGVISYSPVIYWRKIKYLLEDTGLKFDEVAAFIDISDIENEAVDYYLDTNGNVAGSGVSRKIYCEGTDGLSGLKTLIKNNSIFIYSMLYNLDKISKLRGNINIKRARWTIDRNIYNAYGEKGLETASLHMDNLRELLDKHGIKLTVAVYPWPDQIINRDLDSIQVLYWKDWCDKRAIPFINYFPYFINGRTKKELKDTINKYYNAYDIHWNQNGHRLIADVFLDFYRK